MTEISRRQLLQLGAAGLLLGNGLSITAAHAEGSTVTIAYNVNLPAWDPTTGLSAVNPTIQAIYRSVFDQFIGQKPSLEFQPGLLTEWGWSDDKKQVFMTVREGVKYLPEKSADLFFVTLNKSDKEYSPTTMYNDYSINDVLFHWQSQSTTSEASNTGQRYIHHKEMGSQIVEVPQ